MAMSWKRVKNRYDDIHIIPVPDALPHTAGMTCWCQPWRDDKQRDIVVHNCFNIGRDGEGLEPPDGKYH